jgi:hypothetical protein
MSKPSKYHDRIDKELDWTGKIGTSLCARHRVQVKPALLNRLLGREPRGDLTVTLHVG